MSNNQYGQPVPGAAAVQGQQYGQQPYGQQPYGQQPVQGQQVVYGQPQPVLVQYAQPVPGAVLVQGQQAAPSGNVMDRNLAHQSDLFVKQSRKGWLQECLGCEAKQEYKIATLANKSFDVMHANEDSGCCIRICCGPMRPFTMSVTAGGGAGGEQILSMKRPLRCPAAPCQCCWRQAITVFDAGTNGMIGKTKLPFYWCVPFFKVYDAHNVHTYDVSPPTCCGGCCVHCCHKGCCVCSLPFYIMPPGQTGTEQNNLGVIEKVWGGLGTELFTDADKFAVRFPPNVDSATKGNLIGTLFLIDLNFFENHGGGGI